MSRACLFTTDTAAKVKALEDDRALMLCSTVDRKIPPEEYHIDGMGEGRADCWYRRAMVGDADVYEHGGVEFGLRSLFRSPQGWGG